MEPEKRGLPIGRQRLRQEKEAVGHSAVGPYLWAGAVDVYVETGERELRAALERIWDDALFRLVKVRIVSPLLNGCIFRDCV